MNWSEWKRKNGLRNASKSRPCPVCGKPDWCLVAVDGSYAVCPRVGSGKRLGDVGWIHGNPKRSIVHPTPGPMARKVADFDVVAETNRLCRNADQNWIECRASELGVDPESLIVLQVGKTMDGLCSFPMSDYDHRLIGIRIRDQHTGKKWAWPGSCNGLFIPSFNISPFTEHTLVVEGPTDTAAAMTLGFHAVGRASAMSNFDILRAYFRRNNDRIAVVVADMDNGVGVESAIKLSKHLSKTVRTKLIGPRSGKDIRQWLQDGATAAAVMSQIRQSAEVVA